MAAVLSTFLRGMLGVAAAVLIVAVAWTLYLNRAAVMDAVEPVSRLIAPGPAPAPDAERSVPRPPAGDAPASVPAGPAPEPSR